MVGFSANLRFSVFPDEKEHSSRKNHSDAKFGSQQLFFTQVPVPVFTLPFMPMQNNNRFHFSAWSRILITDFAHAKHKTAFNDTPFP